MKEEIQKILDECEENQHDSWVMDIEKATLELQKLFLGKQIELLRDVKDGIINADDEMGVIGKIEELEFELKQLQ